MKIITTLDTMINAAYDQAKQFNHSPQTTQQGIKQAILAVLCSNNVEPVYIRDLSVSCVVYSTEPCEGFRPGRLLRMPNNHSYVITDGVTIANFTTKETNSVKDSFFVGTARTSKAVAADAHDGRHATSLKLDEYAIGSSTNYIMFNDYLIMNMLWNDDQRDLIISALLNPDTDSTKLVVNHKNNDSRDCSADNLEFCEQTLNIRHGQFIQMIAASKKYSWLCGTPYYVTKSASSDKGKWVTPLKFGLSAYEVSEVLDTCLDTIIKNHGLIKEEE